MPKQFIVITAVLAIAVLATFLYFTQSNTPQQPSPTPRANNLPQFYGKTYSKSDVAGQADTPIPIIVTAISSQNYQTLSSKTDVPPNYLSLELTSADIAGYTKSDSTGNYALGLPPGDYHICVVFQPGQGSEPKLPLITSGCLDKNFRLDTSINLDLYWGLGGLFHIQK